MIDKRLMNPEFNPIDDHAILLPRSDEMVRAGQVFVTLFDRAMLAAIATLAPNEDPKTVAEFAADFAIAFLEKRASCLGIEVTP